ncbi:hypothetical protein UFOVP128_44 [uncultured Caudovirales phage]|uniref:Uncharacterized protein n=1 Tax=uncultured Caudovirales phage TaxID=2100421 RepID=A0A6J5LCS3_9CAUD|nr:hypothetical protein UFOVP128_44 [uncultured Caudovirales phage]CAB5222106.1 hypothetical protein UFOVP243_75 [uncultured Caudovirales phage]
MEVPIVKRWVETNEWYPVYELHRDGAAPFEQEVHIPETLVQRYAKAYQEFRAVQDILRGLCEEED